MAFRLGMPVLIEIDDINKTIELCQNLKLSLIELNMNLPAYSIDNLTSSFVKNIGKDTGIEFTLHLPDEVDIAYFDYSIRKGSVDCFEKAIEWAYDAGVNILNIHLSKGPIVTLPDKKVYIYEQYSEKYNDIIIDSFKKISDLAQKTKIKVCVENSENFHMPFIRNVIPKICSLDGIMLTWDIGHDAKTGYKEREVFLKNSDKVKHMHLHDYDGISNHKPLFSGNVDIKEKLLFAKENQISVVIEVKTEEALIESVESLNKLGIKN